METPATYTTTSSTSAGDLLGQIQRIIDERDAYRAKCARQGAIIAKLADMMGELQAFIDEAPQEAMTAPEADRWDGNARPDDALIAQWAEEYDAGTSCKDIAKRYGVAKYRIAGYISQYRRQQRAAVPEPETPDDDELSDADISDDTVETWVRLMDDHHRTAEWIADQYEVNPYYVRGRVRQWREEHGETMEAA